jgi:hypothetical protein
LEHFQVIAGVNATLTAHARTEGNGIFSLTGVSLDFRVGRSPRRLDSAWPIFDVTGTVVDSSNGVFTVALIPTNTQWMSGDYQHETWATDGSGNLSVVSEGRFRVRDPISSLSG